jgi:hypothetical protein
LAPLTTEVVWFWTLLALFVSLLDVMVAVETKVAGPGPSARKRIGSVLTSPPRGPIVPSTHSTRWGNGGAAASREQPAGASTKLAPAGTGTVRRTFNAAVTALLSMIDVSVTMPPAGTGSGSSVYEAICGSAAQACKANAGANTNSPRANQNAPRACNCLIILRSWRSVLSFANKCV